MRIHMINPLLREFSFSRIRTLVPKYLRSPALRRIRVQMKNWQDNNTWTLHFPRLFGDRNFSVAANGRCLQGANGLRVGTMTATSERLA